MTIRNDDFMRGEGTILAGGPTREQVKEQIWGPYRFTPATGPGEKARADGTGRVTPYESLLLLGEELLFQLEPTTPPSWSIGTSQDQWRQDRGEAIRLAFDAHHTARVRIVDTAMRNQHVGLG